MEPKSAEPLMQFQAGLYHRPFGDLISIEVREDAYFRGIHSNHFLTACVDFGNTLDKLSTMYYDGRKNLLTSGISSWADQSLG